MSTIFCGPSFFPCVKEGIALTDPILLLVLFSLLLSPDTSFVNVDLGLQGIYAQLTVPEAIVFSQKLEALLKK